MKIGRRTRAINEVRVASVFPCVNNPPEITRASLLMPATQNGRFDHLLAIRVFARVVESGTFTRAADSLGMPKPTVTKLVQSLESRLRVKLLNRTTRRVTVTADGAAYYERTARVISDLEEIESSMSSAQAAPRGLLRIDLPTSIANMLIVPALPDFLARYPDVQIHVGVTDRVIDLVSDNVDCVIRAGEIKDQSLVARRIADLAMITCATPGYLEKYGVPTHPSQLETDHYVVGYLLGGTSRVSPYHFARKGSELEINGRHRIAVNGGNTYLAAALAGMGIAQVMQFQVHEHFARGELVPVLSDWCNESLPLHVVYPPNRHVSTKLRVFVDWAVELFAAQPRSAKIKCSEWGA